MDAERKAAIGMNLLDAVDELTRLVQYTADSGCGRQQKIANIQRSKEIQRETLELLKEFARG